MPTLDDLAAALAELDDGPDAYGPADGPHTTAVELPAALHRAATIATNLGMADSLTAATSDALTRQVRRFAQQQSFADHLAQFPTDHPDLDDVVHRRVAGTSHPATRHQDLVAALARRHVERHPDWATSGHADEAADRILELVELADLLDDGPAGTTGT